MKIKYLFLGLLATTMVACSSDDSDTGPATPVESTTDYFPLAKGNQWTYHNVRQSYDNPTSRQSTTQDFTENLTVTDTLHSNGSTSYTLTSDVTAEEQGLATLLLSNGKVTKVDGKLIFNGEFVYNIQQIGQTLSIPLTNLTLYDQNASSGDVLFSLTDTITKTFDLGTYSIPVTFAYTFSNAEGDVLESYITDTQEFMDVISSNFSLELSATAQVPGLGFEIPIIADQQIVASTNYFAKDVGLIYSQSGIHVEFEDLSEYGMQNLNPINVDLTQTLVAYPGQGGNFM